MNSLYTEALKHIKKSYQGVFSPEAIQNHFDTYIKLDHSRDQLTVVRQICGLKKGETLLDIGCGFGSFVFVAREAGIYATGIDIADFDLGFAKNRMNSEISGQDPNLIYLHRNALDTKLPGGEFDVVTAWNVLEHVPNYRNVIGEVHRLLKPGGWFIGVAPNYLALRKEAHYQVLWPPLLPKRIGRVYLKLLGKKPEFLENNIFYLTNLGVLATLKDHGFKIFDPQVQRLLNPETIRSPKKRQVIELLHRFRLVWIIKIAQFAIFRNPFKSGIFFSAQKV
jgi:2-polyprenyl-3-methyl-5-hydroxy-6-metoxy-1,4-benzoquinol methylase